MNWSQRTVRWSLLWAIAAGAPATAWAQAEASGPALFGPPSIVGDAAFESPAPDDEANKGEDDEAAIKRLPPVETPTPEAPDPPASGAATTGGQPNSLVNYAGGAVKFQLPAEWNVGEMSVGREVRLALTPGEVPAQLNQFHDGIVISYFPHDKNAGPPARALSRLLAVRLAQNAWTVRSELAKADTIHAFPAVSQDFRIIVADQVQTGLRGTQMLVQLPRGVFELQLLTDDARFTQRSEELAALLASAELGIPRETAVEPPEELAQAEAILGAWKSPEGRMVFSTDGQVVNQFDGARNYALDSQGRYNYEHQLRQLKGAFQADGNLLRITWEDGSLLNFRWHVDGPRLFLTDHHGRVSRLDRLYQ